MSIADILSWFCLISGGALGIIAGIGLNRFPDFYTRMHAAGTTDTLSAALILIGLGIQAGISFAAVKLLFIFVFIFFTSPTASHSLANAAVLGQLKPMLDKK